MVERSDKKHGNLILVSNVYFPATISTLVKSIFEISLDVFFPYHWRRNRSSLLVYCKIRVQRNTAIPESLCSCRAKFQTATLFKKKTLFLTRFQPEMLLRKIFKRRHFLANFAKIYEETFL